MEKWIPKEQPPLAPLPEELEALLETLAENVHDTWARERIREGWSWGPERSDTLKQTPVLVPYARLPESEKEYDRRTAANTLQTLLAAGYEIRRVR